MCWPQTGKFLLGLLVTLTLIASAIGLWLSPSRLRATLGPFEQLARPQFSPDGTILATMTGPYGNRGPIQLWDVATGQLRAVLETDPRYTESLTFCPDGRLLAVEDNDCGLRIWDVQTGQERATLPLSKHSDFMPKFCFSPDGKTLAFEAYSTMGSVVRLWDTETEQEMAALQGAVSPLAFTPDSHTLAVSFQDETQPGVSIRLYDVDTGRQRAILLGLTGTVHRLVFAPDARTAASVARVAHEDQPNEVRVWDTITGRGGQPSPSSPTGGRGMTWRSARMVVC
jgi:WD40 repeat protein